MKKEKLYISFIGPKGCGKNTCSEVLKNIMLDKSQETVFQELMFAGKIKEVSCKVLGLPMVFFEDRVLKEKDFASFSGVLGTRGLVYTEEMLMQVADEFGIQYNGPKKMAELLGKRIESPREFMKLTATEFLREYDPHIHVKKTLELINDVADVVSFTDMRFLSELESVSDLQDGKVVFVWVDNEEANLKLEKDIKNGVAHESEKGILELRKFCHFEVNNNKPGFSEIERQISLISDQI